MDIVMPQLGETVSEGTLTIWHKSVGDEVAANEVLFEIGTDKVEMEVPTPAAGVLKEIRVEAGETVGVGTVLAILDDGSGATEATPTSVGTLAPPAAPAGPPTQPTRRGQAPAAKRDKSLRLSPVVRKLLAENNLQPDQITGTGRDDRIKRADVLAFLKGTPVAPAVPSARPHPPSAASARM